MIQGDRNIIDYLVEFEIIVIQIGSSGDKIWIKSYFERGLDDEIQGKISHMIRSDDTLVDIARAIQRIYEYDLRLKSKIPLRIIISITSSYRIDSPSHRAPSSSSSPSHPRPLIYNTTVKLSESQYSEYQNNE